MRVNQFKFVDFRGFSEAELSVGNLNTVVLAGPNGSGKSSVLDALGSLVACAPELMLMSQRSLFGGGEPDNIRVGGSRAIWEAEFAHGDEHFGFSLAAMHEQAVPTGREPLDPADSGFFSTWAKALRSDEGEPPTLPVLSYLHSGSTRPELAPRKYSQPLSGRLSAYVGAFDQEAGHFRALEQWFEQEENLENEARVTKRNLKFQSKTLQPVRDAIGAALGHLHSTGLGDIRVLRSHTGGPLSDVRGRLTIAKRGEPLFIDQLSDGERRLILLVGDVARRMAILNPHLENPLDSPGILLADEIDLHLHPGWQRRVMGALRAAFPNVQIIVSTHSPQVLASVQSECVVLMKDFRFLPGHPRVFGRDSNTILKDVFEVGERPDDVARTLESVYDLLSDKPQRARKLYNTLRVQLGDDDPELARIETLLELAGA